MPWKNSVSHSSPLASRATHRDSLEGAGSLTDSRVNHSFSAVICEIPLARNNCTLPAFKVGFMRINGCQS
jgi:hypothetical protein